MKKLQINSAAVCILRYDETFFQGFESIKINTGEAILSGEAYARLAEHKLSINGAGVHIVDIAGTPVDVGDAVLDQAGGYRGKFLVGGKVRVLHQQALEGVTGIIARTVIAPLGTAFDFKVTGKVRYHPPGAAVTYERVTADMDYVRGLPPGAVVWSTGDVHALDTAAAARIHEQGMSLMGARLLVTEEIDRLYGSCFTADRRTVIPAGCEYVGDDLTLSAANAELYGKRLYIKGDLIVNLDGAEALNAMEQVLVTGDAIIPHATLARWKAIGRAGTVTPYKGELWRREGHTTISRGQLEAAGEAGTAYTLMLDGAAVFEADVRAEDLACIAAIYYSGAVTLPDAIIPAFNRKVVRGDGVVSPHRTAPAAPKQDEDDDTLRINTGSFMRI